MPTKKTFFDVINDFRTVIVTILAVTALFSMAWGSVIEPRINKIIDKKIDKIVTVINKQTQWMLYQQRIQDPKAVEEFEKEYQKYKENEVE